MTKREAFENVIAGNITEEVIEVMHKALEAMDKSNAKRAEKAAEKRAANDPLKDAIAALLTETPQTASDITAKLDGEYKVQKISAMLRKLVEDERAHVEDVKIKGKGLQKGYTL